MVEKAKATAGNPLNYNPDNDGRAGRAAVLPEGRVPGIGAGWQTGETTPRWWGGFKTPHHPIVP